MILQVCVCVCVCVCVQLVATKSDFNHLVNYRNKFAAWFELINVLIDTIRKTRVWTFVPTHCFNKKLRWQFLQDNRTWACTILILFSMVHDVLLCVAPVVIFDQQPVAWHHVKAPVWLFLLIHYHAYSFTMHGIACHNGKT